MLFAIELEPKRTLSAGERASCARIGILTNVVLLRTVSLGLNLDRSQQLRSHSPVCLKLRGSSGLGTACL